MSRMNVWAIEMREGLRRENWSLSGPARIVKVIAAGTEIGVNPKTNQWGGLGYITLGKNLVGRTPKDIEGSLGLRIGSMTAGAWIYKISQFPLFGQYEYELTADYPDGLSFNPIHASPFYPPGARWAHQWRITDPNFRSFNPAYYALATDSKFPYDWLLTK
jgi:hypothetical protein